jgi:hypothetical protein
MSRKSLYAASLGAAVDPTVDPTDAYLFAHRRANRLHRSLVNPSHALEQFG